MVMTRKQKFKTLEDFPTLVEKRQVLAKGKSDLRDKQTAQAELATRNHDGSAEKQAVVAKYLATGDIEKLRNISKEIADELDILKSQETILRAAISATKQTVKELMKVAQHECRTERKPERRRIALAIVDAMENLAAAKAERVAFNGQMASDNIEKMSPGAIREKGEIVQIRKQAHALRGIVA